MRRTGENQMDNLAPVDPPPQPGAAGDDDSEGDDDEFVPV
jgi:hypothetical protein